MRSRFCKTCRQWHTLDAWPHYAEPSQRSSLPSPMLIRDGMDPTLNHMDGKLYDSKRAFQKTVKAHGGEIIGNDRIATKPPTFNTAPAEADVKQAMQELGMNT